MKKLFLLLLLGVFVSPSNSQTVISQLVNKKELSAGNFCAYDNSRQNTPLIDFPKGFKPFYISHFGRHGSRYHSSEKYYKKPLDLLLKAKEYNCLSEKGDSLLSYLKIISEDAKGRYGDLTPRGVREHQGIAERMYNNFPEVFDTNSKEPTIVESRSTMVVRCVLSMAAFNERLKELNPGLTMIRESSERYLDYLFVRTGGRSQYKSAKAVCDSLKKEWIDSERFFNSLIKNKKFIKDEIRSPHHLMYDFFMVAANMQNLDHLNINLYKYFTDDEIHHLWKCVNSYCYLTMGPSTRFGDGMLDDVRPLLKNIIETAEQVINGQHKVSATLRFGHDCSLIPLAALLEIEGASARVDVGNICNNWNATEVSPMATNIQFIFFKNKENQVKVRILLNEHDALLPLKGTPYYNWTDLKAFCEAKYCSSNMR